MMYSAALAGITSIPNSHLEFWRVQLGQVPLTLVVFFVVSEFYRFGSTQYLVARLHSSKGFSFAANEIKTLFTQNGNSIKPIPLAFRVTDFQMTRPLPFIFIYKIVETENPQRKYGSAKSTGDVERYSTDQVRWSLTRVAYSRNGSCTSSPCVNGERKTTASVRKFQAQNKWCRPKWSSNLRCLNARVFRIYGHSRVRVLNRQVLWCLPCFFLSLLAFCRWNLSIVIERLSRSWYW